MSLPLYIIPATTTVEAVTETDGGVTRHKWRWLCPQCERVVREPITEAKREAIEADALCLYCRASLGDQRVKVKALLR